MSSIEETYEKTLSNMVAFNNAIKNISKLDTIGTISPNFLSSDVIPSEFHVQLKVDYDNKYEKKQYRLINEIINSINQSSYAMGNIDKFSISFDNDNIVIDEINTISYKILRKFASKAGYGDIKQQKTNYDETIRKALSIDNFKIKKDIIEKVKNIWITNFPHKNIRVEPYKINIYEKDNFFLEHRDTPSKNLVGSIVVSLYNNSETGKLILKINNDTNEINNTASYNDIEFDEKNFNWIAFYPDVLHRVTPILESDGLRINMTFKIFSLEENNDELIEDLLLKNKNVFNKLAKMESFGLILNHKYSIDTENHALKGVDKYIFDLLSTLPNDFNIDVIPIIYTTNANEYFTNDSNNYSDNDSDDEYDTCGELKVNVYPFTFDDIKYLNDISNIHTKIDERRFYFINKHNFGSVLNEEYDTTGYTGNEYREDSEHQINFTYLARAIIVDTKLKCNRLEYSCSLKK